jgi:APA family basic amino acid/polyamine antiporter
MLLFTAPFLSMAFAFDGWTSVATLSRDMENPQRDIAKVLALNAAIVTAAYVFYFTGMTMIFVDKFDGNGILAAQEIVNHGAGHVGVAAEMILGDIGMKLILFCVVMSVMGTLNGNVMAGFRYPHALAQAKDLPRSDYFVEESKHGTTAKASTLWFGATLAWFVLYTIQAYLDSGAFESHIFSGIGFDDIPIVLISIIIILLLVGAAKFGMKEGHGIFKSIVATIIGIVGQLYIVYSFIQNNSSWWQYILICVAIVAIGFVIRMGVKKKQEA